ncbi:uncharacterized protein LOC126108154 [Schistocerca cancellata]|uniref:uncharacterized protein LOC126108154 n=1 Tax=Schistocerca cancellata TaxID=274614 RepID=UPI0021197470|nr:uncharacterized protein LOC126108154 [Schistocerca cancellata]
MHCYQFPWRWFVSATVHKKMHESKSGANAQVVYTLQVYCFQMLKFLDQATEADESVCNIESTERGSEHATPILEEMFEHEMREPSVSCREPQPQPQHQERPPTKRKGTADVATDVIVKATRTLKAVADMARTLPQPVQEDQYSALATHIAAELSEMDNVGAIFDLKNIKQLVTDDAM